MQADKEALFTKLEAAKRAEETTKEALQVSMPSM